MATWEPRSPWGQTDLPAPPGLAPQTLWVPHTVIDEELQKAAARHKTQAKMARGRFFADRAEPGAQFSDWNRLTGFNASGGMEKPADETGFGFLRDSYARSAIDQIIINTRIWQIRQVGRRCLDPQRHAGWRIVHKLHDSPKFRETPEIQARCDAVAKVVGLPNPGVHPGGLVDVLAISVREQLTIDRRVMIISRDRLRRPVAGGWHLQDGACYSADTEVLTRRGWRRFDDVTPEDEFMTRKIGTGNAEWQKAFYFHDQDWTGREVMHFRSRTVDLLVTPNHRMLTQWKATKEWAAPPEAIRTAEDLERLKALRAVAIPAWSRWRGVMPTTGDGITVAGERVALADWCAFMGMWLAEGSVGGCLTGGTPHSYSVTISQEGSSPFYAEIEALLERLPFGFRRNGHSWRVGHRALWDELRPLGSKYTKYVPQWMKDLPPEYLAILWEWTGKGDGTRGARRTGKRAHIAPQDVWRVTTASPRLADDWQEILAKLGRSGSISVHRPSQDVFIRGRRIAKDHQVPHYIINERVTARFSLPTPTREVYNGHVYCVSVPNEVLYVRRNGIPQWCGNTVLPRLEVLYPWIAKRLTNPQEPGRAYDATEIQSAIDGAISDVLDATGIDLEDAAYVQEIDSHITAAWLAHQVSVGISQPSVIINKGPYGQGSILQQSLDLTAGWVNFWQYNQSHFRTNYPEKALILHGEYDPNGLEAYKRKLFGEAGPASWERLLLLPGDEDSKAESVDLGSAPKDLMWDKLADMIIKLKCACYRLDPSTIGWDGGIKDSGIVFNPPNKEFQVAMAQEEGFHGLLQDLSTWITDSLVRPWDEDLLFIFDGLQRQQERERIELSSQAVEHYWTLDEARAKENLKPLPDGLGAVPMWAAQAKLQASNRPAPGVLGEGAPDEAGQAGDRGASRALEQPRTQPPGNPRRHPSAVHGLQKGAPPHTLWLTWDDEEGHA